MSVSPSSLASLTSGQVGQGSPRKRQPRMTMASLMSKCPRWRPHASEAVGRRPVPGGLGIGLEELIARVAPGSPRDVPALASRIGGVPAPLLHVPRHVRETREADATATPHRYRPLLLEVAQGDDDARLVGTGGVGPVVDGGEALAA